MRIIVDAGSSKTDIAVVSRESGVTLRKQYPGINPSTDIHFEKKMEEICIDLKDYHFTECYYYGSGVIGKNSQNKVEAVIAKYWNHLTEVFITDDLIGAAKCTHGDNAGLTGILGTGSNFGYYNGDTIIEKIASSGYLLGDEGSGYRIGQAIYRKFARQQFAPQIIKNISTEHHIDPNKAISHLYSESNPRTFLARFAKTITVLPLYIQKEITDEVFDAFIERMVLPLTVKYKHPVSLVGSIAFYFQDILLKKFEKSNIAAGLIVRSPIEGLIKYHEYG